MKKIFLVLLSAALLTSCNNGGDSSKSSEPVRPQFQGDLVEKAKTIYSAEDQYNFYSCDSTWNTRILEMVTAIESNKANIVKLQAEQLSKNPKTTLVKINGFDFIDSVPVDHPDVWEQYRYSWKEAYQTYLQIKDKPLDEAWIDINADARSLILEDEYRIYYSSHPGIRLKDKENILGTFAVVEKCNADLGCTTLTLTADQAKWLQEGILHSYILSKLNDSETYAWKRKQIAFLYRDLKDGAERFGFYKNPLISLENGVVIVPMNLSVFGVEQNVLIQRLQNLWSVFGLKVQIVDSGTGYEVKMDSTPGERAFVSHSKKIMQLYSPTRFVTIEHEFGHVLGLMDTYFTSFDQATCEYVEDYNRGDIMSAHGKVLPVHINQIKQGYGL